MDQSKTAYVKQIVEKLREVKRLKQEEKWEKAVEGLIEATELLLALMKINQDKVMHKKMKEMAEGFLEKIDLWKKKALLRDGQTTKQDPAEEKNVQAEEEVEDSIICSCCECTNERDEKFCIFCGTELDSKNST